MVSMPTKDSTIDNGHVDIEDRFEGKGGEYLLWSGEMDWTGHYYVFFVCSSYVSVNAGRVTCLGTSVVHFGGGMGAVNIYLENLCERQLRRQ